MYNKEKGGIGLGSVKISELSHIDFDVRNIAVGRFDFPSRGENDYLEKGRQRNLIHLITSGNRLYKTEVESFTVPTGTVLFIPDGTRYLTRALHTKESGCSGIGISFDTVDGCGREISIEKGVYHDWRDYHNYFSGLFEEMTECAEVSPRNTLRMKSLLLRILCRMVTDSGHNQLTKNIISPALTFIAKHYRENLPVRVYAEQCNMSESYFRKKFVELTGKSPIEYRNELRFAEARRLYAEGYSMKEISASLGFFDAGYFAKIYKKSNGRSLSREESTDIV